MSEQATKAVVAKLQDILADDQHGRYGRLASEAIDLLIPKNNPASPFDDVCDDGFRHVGKDTTTIDASLARQLRRSMERNARLVRALQDIKDMCAGEKSPNWKDDWATVKSREKIIDICDAAAQQKE